MSPEVAFGVLNAIVLPVWAVWLIAPRSAVALGVASHAATFLVFCALYAALLVAAILSSPPAGLDFADMRQALSTPLGFLAGWTHYLAFDLFVGAWILRESRRLSVEPRVYLVFALMVGPIGLGAFLIRRVLRLRSFGQIGEADLV